MPRTILVTGACSGFGRLVALDLARHGHRVVATARGWSQVTGLIDAARAEGITLQVEKLDVTNAADRERAFGWDIDVLVSNAGVREPGPIADQPMELLRAMFEANVFAGIALAQGFARQFVRRGGGRIVFVSAGGGLGTAPYGAGYRATRHALYAVAEGLKTELAPSGVSVATAEPGGPDSTLLDTILADPMLVSPLL